jgi:hypothetical protein
MIIEFDIFMISVKSEGILTSKVVYSMLLRFLKQWLPQGIYKDLYHVIIQNLTDTDRVMVFAAQLPPDKPPTMLYTHARACKVAARGHASLLDYMTANGVVHTDGIYKNAAKGGITAYLEEHYSEHKEDVDICFVKNINSFKFLISKGVRISSHLIYWVWRNAAADVLPLLQQYLPCDEESGISLTNFDFIIAHVPNWKPTRYELAYSAKYPQLWQRVYKLADDATRREAFLCMELKYKHIKAYQQSLLSTPHDSDEYHLASLRLGLCFDLQRALCEDILGAVCYAGMPAIEQVYAAHPYIFTNRLRTWSYISSFIDRYQPADLHWLQNIVGVPHENTSIPLCSRVDILTYFAHCKGSWYNIACNVYHEGDLSAWVWILEKLNYHQLRDMKKLHSPRDDRERQRAQTRMDYLQKVLARYNN